LHDVVIILGFFAFFQWEFSLPVLAAVLAVLGYSVNESVVVFDRVREIFKKKRGMTTPEVLNHAITSTISRTIITHGCTQLMVTSMLIFGGVALHYFAVALTIGICFGIYSSVLVASPLVMWLGVSPRERVRRLSFLAGFARNSGKNSFSRGFVLRKHLLSRECVPTAASLSFEPPKESKQRKSGPGSTPLRGALLPSNRPGRFRTRFAQTC
jgi:multidrug efflux pump subunit AcrB